jgi:hypothetical protein
MTALIGSDIKASLNGLVVKMLVEPTLCHHRCSSNRVSHSLFDAVVGRVGTEEGVDPVQ